MKNTFNKSFLILGFIFIVIHTGIKSQDGFEPKKLVGIHVNSLIDYKYPALNISFDYRITENICASIESGIINDFNGKVKHLLWNRGISGFRFGIAYKYSGDTHFPDKRKREHKNKAKIQIGLKYRFQHSIRDIELFVWRQNHEFEEQITFQQKVVKSEYLALVGKNYRLSDKFFFSLFTHFGITQLAVTDNLPQDVNIYNRSWLSNRNPLKESDYTFPVIYFEARIGIYFDK